ncbi:MAG: hypothetical protein JEZ12_21555 [Desulfobacterium sp.]|nr:hypothetical protein [Desulfobacterium sp.]
MESSAGAQGVDSEEKEVEHEMPEFQTELLPPEGDPAVADTVTERANECLQYRKDQGKDSEWNRYHDYRRTKHWKNDPERKLLTANLLATHHQQTVNGLTDNSPTFNVVPAGPLNGDAKEVLAPVRHTLTHFWSNQEQQHILEESVFNSNLYGCVAERGVFNPRINFPQGDVEFESFDPFYFALYPVNVKKLEKAMAVFFFVPMSIFEARRTWPHAADKIVCDSDAFTQIGDDRENNQIAKKGNTRLTWLSNAVRWLAGSSPSEDSSDMVMITEMWVYDYSQGEGGQPIYTGNIRRVRVCSGDVLLDDMDNPAINPNLELEVQQRQYCYSHFPVSVNPSVTDPDSYWGIPDYERLSTLCLELDKTLVQLTQAKDQATRSVLVNPKDSGVDPDDIDDYPGQLRPANYIVAQGLRYMENAPVDANVLQAMSIYKDFFNEVGGSFSDVMQGQKGGSEVIAAKAIALLLEQQSRMLKGQARNLHKMLRERGRIWLSLAQSFYTETRWITAQIDGQDQSIEVTPQKLQVPANVMIVAGSTMPVSDIQRRDEMMGLAKGGFVDQKAVLTAFNVPDAEDIIKRMQAGPLGEFLSKLKMIGVPDPILQVFQKIGQEKPEKVEQAIKAGEVQPFAHMIQALQGQFETPPDPEMVKAENDRMELEAKIQEINAKTVKEQADARLVEEKILTERFDRLVKAKGVEFDTTKLDADLANEAERLKLSRAELVLKARGEKEGRELEGFKAVADHAVKKEQVKHSQQKHDGPYRERGMKSNNQGD